MSTLEQVRAHLDAIDTIQSSLRCDPDEGESDSSSKKRGAGEAAEDGGAAKKLKLEDNEAAKKLKLEDNEAASEDKEIVPDLDDPHIPTWVWDWLQKDGKITEAERHLVAQHEDEAGGNLCVKCGVDMGADNPRQYCGKNMCLGLGFE